MVISSATSVSSLRQAPTRSDDDIGAINRLIVRVAQFSRVTCRPALNTQILMTSATAYRVERPIMVGLKSCDVGSVGGVLLTE